MKKVKYKELEWYVIKEDEKGKLLFLAERLRPEIVDKYFEHDEDYDVKFNYDYTNLWWRDSYIRQVLNSSFLKELDINDLNTMDTTVELDGTKVNTRDYVRLLTKEEAEALDVEIRKTNDEYGYWLMSPSYWSGGNAHVFRVGGSSNTGYLSNYYVHHTYGVRPVVSLKSNTLTSVIEANNPVCDNEIFVDTNGYIHTNEGSWKGRKMDIAFVNKINELQKEMQELKERL